MSRPLSLLLLLLSLFAAPIRAEADAGAVSPAAVLQRFVDRVQTLDARFEQIQTDDRGGVTAESTGRFLLARPPADSPAAIGRFRWRYETPYAQDTICDGHKLWAWEPDLDQVTVRDARRALAGTPAALLSQRSALNRQFTASDGGTDGEARVVLLKPKAADSDFTAIELSIDARGAPTRMRFRDAIGGSSEIRFRDIVVNGAIDAAQFRFAPPSGAEIVDGDGPADAPTP